MINVEINIQTQALTDALRRLEGAARNPQPVLQHISDYLDLYTRMRFDSAKAPDGSPWADNSPVTIARKGRNEPLVGRSGDLRDTLRGDINGNTLVFGSDRPYAAVQQFGASKGQFGKTRRGGSIPWGDIPARPFLGLSKDDEDNITDIINEYLEGLIRPS